MNVSLDLIVIRSPSVLGVDYNYKLSLVCVVVICYLL